MTPGEKVLMGLVRFFNEPRYSLAWFLAMMVIAGFIGHFL